VTVLIADDSPFLVKRLVVALAKVTGVDIIGQAGTVTETGNAIRDLKPDVVLLDISMPGGGAIDVLESLKASPAIPAIIVLTNYTYPPHHKKCLKLGARFVLNKSTEFEKVGEALQSLTHRASASGKHRSAE
jgi:DNA-binding NarL/FixJ family response regulator